MSGLSKKITIAKKKMLWESRAIFPLPYSHTRKERIPIWTEFLWFGHRLIAICLEYHQSETSFSKLDFQIPDLG